MHSSPGSGLVDLQLRASNEGLSILYISLKGSGQGCPLLRASNEHIPIVRVLEQKTTRIFTIFLSPSLGVAWLNPPLRASNEGHLILSTSLKGSGQGCPLLRASNEHIPIVRVLRARRAPGRSLPLP